MCLLLGKRVINPAPGLPARVVPVKGRGLMRPQ